MKIELNHSNPTIHEALQAHKSPENEASILKGVKLEHLEAFKQVLRDMFPDSKIYVKYRGPRKEQNGRHCLKENAKSAAIYFKRYYVAAPFGSDQQWVLKW